MSEAQDLLSDIEALETKLQEARTSITRRFIGQERVVDLTLATLLCGGHGLLIGLPGLGKTRLVEALSTVMGLNGNRVQFTPDLMPADILGSEVLDTAADGTRAFRFVQGPIFCQLLMADEINRASPRTQSALLQAMQEKTVTVAGQDRALGHPFHVLATQNPIELEGTYPLPEAQLDRFLFKLEVTRNDVATMERIINFRELGTEPTVEAIMDHKTLDGVLALVRRIYLPEPVANYIARLVDATHPGRSQAAASFKYGASPRAALSLASAAKARAVLNGRTHASFEDVKFLAPSVLRHRVLLGYNAKVEGKTADSLIDEMLAEVSFEPKLAPQNLQA